MTRVEERESNLSVLACPSCKKLPKTTTQAGLSYHACCGATHGGPTLDDATRFWNEHARWLPIGEARKDRTRYLLKLKKRSYFPEHASRWHENVFVGCHNGLAEDGFDVGWAFASPVGSGGFPDSWIAGFQEIAGVTELGPWEPWKDDE